VFAYVEKSQPYNGPHGVEHHPLWLLAQLSNADKHRAILMRACSHTRSPDLRAGGPGIEFLGKAEFICDQPLFDGAEILRGRFRPMPGAQPQVEVMGHLPIDLAFGEDLVPSQSLRVLRDAVAEVVTIGVLSGADPRL
jgi:hypothetical protein